MEWDGWIECDAMRLGLGGRADRADRLVHAYRAETGPLGHVIHEPPADWDTGRTGQYLYWSCNWPQWTLPT